MKYLFIVLTLFFTTAFSSTTNAETSTEKVIIVFKNQIEEESIKHVNGTIENALETLPIVTGEIPEAAIKQLEKDENILSVEKDQRVSISSQTEGWGLNHISVYKAWEKNFTGKGINVAILDTGIAPHDDLSISGGVSLSELSTSYYDDNGHGSHIAGIIGAKNNNIGTVGVAPNTKMYAVKVLDHEGYGYLSDVIAGIEWSITNKMDIINLSLSMPLSSSALKNAVDEAYNNGLLVVAAGGNNGDSSGTTDTVEYPAKYSSVIAVGAIDVNNKRPSFSATGSSIELVAPGVNILSTYLNNKTLSMDGTSMATAYVSGALALLKESNPKLTNKQIRQKLQVLAKDLGSPGRDSVYGYGLIQVSQEPVVQITKRYRIYTGTFSTAKSLANAKDKLTAKRSWNIYEKATSLNFNPKYRLYTGLFKDKNKAEYEANKLRKEFGWNVYIQEE